MKLFKAFNTKIIFKTMGALLIIETLFMLLALAVSWYYRDASLEVFAVCSFFTFASGCLGLYIGKDAPKMVGEREGYMIVALVWIIFSFFGMLPYYFSGSVSSLTDAWFETMSGFTTTGATILPDVERLDRSVLFWRSLTQWLGGMGIIVLSIALLPMFGMSGMQLYAAEVTGVSYEKISPRLSTTAKYLWMTYLLLTLLETTLLWFEGMPLFDSLCHSLTTIATGGFSIKNASIAYYSSPLIHYTIIVFMFLSAVNYTLLIYVLMGKGRRLLQDEETRWYFRATVISTIVLTIGLFIQNHTFYIGEEKMLLLHNIERSFRTGLFTAVATISTTSFALTDYLQWMPVMWVIVFFLMFMGGTSGSTSGGAKWVRLAIFVKSGINEFNKRIHPNAVLPVKMNGKVLNQQTINNVMAFFFLYILIIVAAVLIFCAFGVNFDESIGAAVSAINNIGPGIGQYGPAATFAHFPTACKWVMTFVMLIGRLEIFTVLLLFSRVLWK